MTSTKPYRIESIPGGFPQLSEPLIDKLARAMHDETNELMAEDSPESKPIAWEKLQDVSRGFWLQVARRAWAEMAIAAGARIQNLV